MRASKSSTGTGRSTRNSMRARRSDAANRRRNARAVKVLRGTVASAPPRVAPGGIASAAPARAAPATASAADSLLSEYRVLQKVVADLTRSQENLHMSLDFFKRKLVDPKFDSLVNGTLQSPSTPDVAVIEGTRLPIAKKNLNTIRQRQKKYVRKSMRVLEKNKKK